jgi:hypothetical protein
MKAITVEPRKPGSANLEEVPEPDVHHGSVLVEAIAVGCFVRWRPPSDRRHIECRSVLWRNEPSWLVILL